MTERRALPRNAVTIVGTIVATHGEKPLRVRNLSQTGLMADTWLPLTVGERVTVYLDCVGAVAATVRWQADYKTGLQFSVPLSASMLSGYEKATRAA